MKILSRLKVNAEDSWFDSLSDEQKKSYLEEHPDSKYAKNSKKKSVKPKIEEGTAAIRDINTGKIIKTSNDPQELIDELLYKEEIGDWEEYKYGVYVYYDGEWQIA